MSPILMMTVLGSLLMWYLDCSGCKFGINCRRSLFNCRHGHQLMARKALEFMAL